MPWGEMRQPSTDGANEREQLRELVIENDRLQKACDALTAANAYVQYMVDWLEGRGLLEDHCYSFPDGLTIWATGHEPQVVCLCAPNPGAITNGACPVHD